MVRGGNRKRASASFNIGTCNRISGRDAGDRRDEVGAAKPSAVRAQSMGAKGDHSRPCAYCPVERAGQVSKMLSNGIGDGSLGVGQAAQVSMRLRG